MTRRTVRLAWVVLGGWAVAMLLAGTLGLATGSPSGEALSLAGGLCLTLFALVSVGFALRALSSPEDASDQGRSHRLASGWALTATWLLLSAMVCWTFFLPLGDVAKPIVELVLLATCLASAVGSGACFRAAFATRTPVGV